MGETSGLAPPSPPVPLVKRAICSVLTYVCAGVEYALSARCLMPAFLFVCGMLCVSGWLRPPMRTDLRAVEILFQHDAADVLTPESVSATDYSVRYGSVGLILLCIVAGGLVVVAVRRQSFPIVCGTLLCFSIAANASVAWNHPVAVETLEFELEQAARIQHGLTDQYEISLSRRGQYSRELAAPVADEHRADLILGWKYLQYGLWLVVAAAAGFVVSFPGDAPRRLGFVAGYGVLGVVLAVVVCRQRLTAEYFWQQACHLEQEGRFVAAREVALRSVSRFPEFANLHRTWFLLGRLDFREGRNTPAYRYFQLYQLSLTSDRVRAVHELKILLKDTDTRQRRPLEQLLGRLLCDEGLRDYREDRFVSAAQKWMHALEIMPTRLDSPFLLALAHASTVRDHPEAIEAYLAPLLPRLRDRVLRAEIWSTLGDAYFQAGEFQVARRCYRQSLQHFHLPKIINNRALKGLVGM